MEIVDKAVQTPEGEISYAVAGDPAGAPILLLPGFQSERGGWIMRKYPQLLSEYRVVLVDPLGHGQSATPHDEAAYTTRAVVSHVAAVLDNENIAQAHMWGFSRGGFITALCGELIPDRCLSVIMGGAPIGSAGTTTLAGLEKMQAILATGDWDTYWAGFPLPLPQALIDHFISTNDPKANAATLRALMKWADEVPNAGLNETGIPTFAYFGTGEVFAAGLRDVLAPSHVAMHEGEWAGHAETMMDAEGVVAVVREFLNSL